MKFIILIVMLFITPALNGQEVLSSLLNNPVLKGEKILINKNKTTISLPFFDDFSYNTSIVNADLWQKSSVFVNRTYPINPITIGVATFDGLDKYGLARDFSQSNSSEPSDTLLSQKIDLSTSNSVYLMFFFQGKGIGDAPQIQDKLVLEFLNDSLAWEQIWYSNGQSMQEFERIVEVIDEQRFLHSSFQFRFRNYATISGNFDHWHIDYIKLDELLSASDTTELYDVSFVYNSPSFLRRYSEMPWKHFVSNEASELKDSINILLRNNDAPVSNDYQYNVFEENNLIGTYPGTLTGWYNIQIQDFNSVGNFYFNPPITINNLIFNSFQTDSATFLIQNIIKTSNLDNKENDTLYHTQNFHSHFSYDDGTAESAYGINTIGAKLAYQFTLNRPDSLRAIQMYFPQMLDSVSHIPFKLTVWDNNVGQPGSIIYQQSVLPKHTENGEFHCYYLDSVFQLIGSFFIGWEQNTDDLLNIGLDKNNFANDYMFYNVGSGWVNSSYPGAWMIRPIVSMNKVISNNDELILDNFKIYPNPTNHELNILLNTIDNLISIYNLQGNLVKQSFFLASNCKINITDLSSGMYVVEVRNNTGSNFQKFIIE